MQNIKSFYQEHKVAILNATFLLLALAIFASASYATGTGDGLTDFDGIWNRIQGWISGTLGKVIAGSMILVGIATGIARQSLMAFIGGIGLAYVPEILGSVFGATL